MIKNYSENLGKVLFLEFSPTKEKIKRIGKHRNSFRQNKAVRFLFLNYLET